MLLLAEELASKIIGPEQDVIEGGPSLKLCAYLSVTAIKSALQSIRTNLNTALKACPFYTAC